MKCSFCGIEFSKGRGKIYVRTDARILYFCSKKCEKNMLKLKRKGREKKWTEESRFFRGKSGEGNIEAGTNVENVKGGKSDVNEKIKEKKTKEKK